MFDGRFLADVLGALVLLLAIALVAVAVVRCSS